MVSASTLKAGKYGKSGNLSISKTNQKSWLCRGQSHDFLLPVGNISFAGWHFFFWRLTTSPLSVGIFSFGG